MAAWHKQLEDAALEGADLNVAAPGAAAGVPSASVVSGVSGVSGSAPPPSTASVGPGSNRNPNAAMSRESFASAALMLDIAFLRARSELSYILELARLHRGIPASGSLHGDNVWLRLGTATLRVVYSRRARVLVVSAPGKSDEQIRWSATERGLVGNDGKRIDVSAYLDATLDSTIRAWKAGPASQAGHLAGDRSSDLAGGERAPMPTLADEGENELARKETRSR